MKLYLNNLFVFIKRNKDILSVSLCLFLLISLFISFFYSISKTNNSFLVPYYPSEEIYNYEESTNVSNFTTDSNENINIQLLSYLSEFFTTRNQSFLTGNVESLYKFYDLSHSYGKHSLVHEFKRIAYIRDWANERGIAFEDITSVPSIDKIQLIDNIIKLDISETFKISYSYIENPNIKNEFLITLFHIEEIQKIGNGFTIQKDHYLDSFENALEKYNFNLTEKYIPLSSYKTYYINFNINTNFSIS